MASRRCSGLRAEKVEGFDESTAWTSDIVRLSQGKGLAEFKPESKYGRADV